MVIGTLVLLSDLFVVAFNSNEIKSRLFMGLLRNLFFSICAEAESRMVHQSWPLFNFGVVTQPPATIFVEMASI